MSLILCLVATFGKAQMIVMPGAAITSTAGSYVVMDNIGMEYYTTPSPLLCTFKFTGNAGASLKATLPIPFTNIEINKTNNAKLVLLDEISAGGTVKFTSGFIDLHGSILNLGGTGLLLNENETNRIIETGQIGGYVVSSYPINAPNNINPGNIGATITASTNLGLVTVKRGQQVKVGTGLNNSIRRNYIIQAANNNALNASLSLQYFDAELNGLDENFLTQFKSTDSVAYVNMNFTTRDAASNFVMKDNYNSLDGLYTLSGNSGGPLPVTITHFTAQCASNAIQLKWQTAAEQNADRFDIQRSRDGLTWQKIGVVPAAGNSSTSLFYYFDDNSVGSGSDFYRLAEYDLDGKITYSSIVKANCEISGLFSVIPNPLKDMAKAIVSTTIAGKASLILLNAAGQQLILKPIMLTAGTNQFEIDMSAYAAGNYNLLLLRKGMSQQVIKLIRL